MGAFSFRTWTTNLMQVSHACLCERTLTKFKQDAAGDIRDWFTIGY